MKVFVTGVNGQLGHDVINELYKRGHECVGSDITPTYHGIDDGTAVVNAPYFNLDITEPDAVRNVLLEVKPDAVIHCAAWTAVDAAEEPKNIETVRAINAGGTQNIANVCKELDCKMLYISTDYVFNGLGKKPWDPDCKDYKPLNVYGQTKLEGELAVANTLEKYFIVRIAWVFGLNGKNFVKTMLDVGKTHDTVRVVNDQFGTPTYTLDLARLLVDMTETDKYGYYHATNEGGYISWYDFACEIFKQAGYNTKVIPVTTEEYGLSKAARPANSCLDKSKLVKNGFEPLPTWQDALSRYLAEIAHAKEFDIRTTKSFLKFCALILTPIYVIVTILLCMHFTGAITLGYFVHFLVGAIYAMVAFVGNMFVRWTFDRIDIGVWKYVISIITLAVSFAFAAQSTYVLFSPVGYSRSGLLHTALHWLPFCEVGKIYLRVWIRKKEKEMEAVNGTDQN